MDEASMEGGAVYTIEISAKRPIDVFRSAAVKFEAI